MWHVLHLIARPFEVLLGLFCVLSAIVLYPNEEGTIQSKFEDFWIRVDDYQQLALSKHAAFMTQVAKLETRFLDRVFGHRLVSGQALGVSFCFSMVGLSLVFVVGERNDPTLRNFFTEYLVLSMIIGAASIFVRRRNIVRRVVVAIPLLLLVIRTLKCDCSGSDTMRLFTAIVGAAILGFGCDMLFITLTRRLLRWAGQMTSSIKVLATVILSLVFVVILASPAFVHPTLSTPLRWQAFLLLTIA
jgi:hypothetical protein